MTIWLIGCGNMAGAMLSRWISTGSDPAGFTVIRPSGRAVAPGVRVLTALPDALPPDRLMLAFKPQQLAAIAPTLSTAIGPQTELISILAGTTHARLAALFPQARNIVRVMPNLPVAIGKGVVALHAPGADRAPLDARFAPLGLVEWIEDEADFDAVTAVSGSGPAFVYRFAEALAKAGAELGLDPALADRLARATLAGAADLAAQSSQPLHLLADSVASKGGSTRSGLDILDSDAVLDRLVGATLAAARKRNAQIG